MDNVLISQPADGVTQLTLNRPERLNALTYDLVTELHDALDAVDRDHSCRAVVITGAGRGFCAGLDLNGFGTVPGTETFGRPQQGMATQQYIARLVPHMRDVRQPIIAAINGPCAGGGFAIALASDVRVCAESARFGTAFVRLGLSGCDIGVSWMLPRLIGASRAWELMLTGRVFDSAEADKLGLVTERVADDQVLAAALGVAERIKANSPFGIRLTKEILQTNVDAPSLEAAIALENRSQVLAVQTHDMAEALAAFREKRLPAYQNH
jgi:enoyl-CoA hydratase